MTRDFHIDAIDEFRKVCQKFNTPYLVLYADIGEDGENMIVHSDGDNYGKDVANEFMECASDLMFGGGA